MGSRNPQRNGQPASTYKGTEVKKKFKETFYEFSEDEMQVKIAAAKEGNGVAQVELLDIFSNFLSKYINVLYYGRYSLADYDMRRFLALFVKDSGVRFFLLRNKLTPAGAKHVNEVLRGIQYMTQRYGDEEDVTQTVQMTFLQCVERYKRRGEIPFSGYLYSYFFYLLKKNVDALLIDQLGRRSFPLLSDDDAHDEWDGEDRPVGFTAPPTPSVEELIHAEEIDEYWVLGDTAHPPFDVLTVQERQLLKWRYMNGERSSDIANRITEHPNTVREHFHKIRARLRAAMDDDLSER